MVKDDKDLSHLYQKRKDVYLSFLFFVCALRRTSLMGEGNINPTQFEG